MPAIEITEPRIVDGQAFALAGLKARFAYGANAAIPELWKRLNAISDGIPGRQDQTAYGVCLNDDGKAFDYIAAVAVTDLAAVSAELAQVQLAPRPYVVISHPGPLADMPALFETIWKSWLPASGHTYSGHPLLERYGPEFNAATGTGGFEIWIPIKT